MNYEILDGFHKRERRVEPWRGIIIHHTGIGDRTILDESLWAKLGKNITTWLSNKNENYVSSHFIIHRDGKCFRMVDPEYFEAYHAGKSTWWHPLDRRFKDDWNKYAIGVELIGDGNLHPYSEAQYNSLCELIKHLMKKYPTIHPMCITGHECVSPGRKDDPGKHFDWLRLFKGIYGGA